MNGRARIAQNLRRIRVAKALSQEALAFEAGVDRSYISGMEGEVFNPTIDILDRLAVTLGVDVQELLARTKGARAKPLKAGRRPK